MGHPVESLKEMSARRQANVISEVTHEFMGSLSSLFSPAPGRDSVTRTHKHAYRFGNVPEDFPAISARFPPNLPAMSRVMQPLPFFPFSFLLLFFLGFFLSLRLQRDGRELNFG